MITRFTITGADDTVDPVELFRIQMAFPFVEFGILLHPEKNGGFERQATEGKNRYPSISWCAKLGKMMPDQVFAEELLVEVDGKQTQLKNLNLPKGMELRLALHLCGEYVEDFAMTGRTTFRIDLPIQFLSRVKRIQLNGIDGYTVCDEAIAYMEVNSHIEFILQCRTPSKPSRMLMNLIEELEERGIRNYSVLFDGSQGKGMAPEEWPDPMKVSGRDIITGYAGGLNKENIATNMALIDNVSNGQPVWVDMETGVRDEEGGFDSRKALEILSIASSAIVDYI